MRFARQIGTLDRCQSCGNSRSVQDHMQKRTLFEANISTVVLPGVGSKSGKISRLVASIG